MKKSNLLFFVIVIALIFSNTNSLGFLKEENDLENIFKLINNTVSTDLNFKHQSFLKTALISDHHGPRLWGSKQLAAAIDEMLELMKKDGFQNPRKEEVPDVTVWVRGNESLFLKSPRKYPTKIPMIGLGVSVGGEVEAEVIVVDSFKDLELKKDLVKDKIVLFNYKWNGYGKTVKYRSQGAIEAAKVGAKAVIIRSVAPSSLETPHTGRVSYDDRYPKIPACAISLEDADMFDRMSKRNQTIIVSLKMEGKILAEKTTSYNVVGEIIGSEKPEEIILIGGHIDSWDTGPQTGANDDLSGFYVCYEAVRTLIKLNLRPKRTIRVIGWSGEEMGFPENGAEAYIKTHKNELKNHILAFESDGGVLDIWGFGYSGNEIGYSTVNFISTIIKDLKMEKLIFDDGENTDTGPLLENNIPLMRNEISVTSDESEYFRYHHSAADTISILNPDFMDRNVIGISCMFYSIANLPAGIPKNK